MISEPKITTTTARTAAVVHLNIPRDEIEQTMDPAIQEVLAAIASQGQAPQGALFAHHLTQSSDRFDIEVGFPVGLPIAPRGRVIPGELPGGLVAVTVYRGNYDGLFAAWTEFGRQAKRLMEREGLSRGDTLWESYVVGPESEPDPANWKTELYLALRKAS